MKQGIRTQGWMDVLARVRDREESDVDLKDVANAADRLDEIAEPMEAVCADLGTKVIPADSPHYHSPEEWERSKAAEMDIRIVRTGNWFWGYTHRQLDPFMGSIGLDMIKETAANLRSIVERQTQIRSKQWPAPYRYRGVFGPNPAGQLVALPAARFEGRVLEAGEVVMLTRHQAESWADRFEPVTEEEQVAS